MNCEKYFSLFSIASILAAAVAIIWFLVCRREIRSTSTASNGIYNNTTSSKSAAVSLSTADSVAAGVYEVFLSFCGMDTRKGFTDFLYTYLVGASICTFRDDNELRVGEEIGPELLKAIKSSKISIPIFSKNYASSKWCLLELMQMVECHKNGKQMIYPIFYDVDPSDVRNQRGVYEKAFCQHKKIFDEETVQSWREALRMVGELKGLELNKETGGHEGELVKIVVEKVLLELKKNYAHVPENLVGMDIHVEKIKGLLKVDYNGVRIIGVHGMGGLGKTTIAKVIYNQLCDLFDGHCFLDNVRENSKHQDGILHLQHQLISKIQNREAPKFFDVYQGSSRIKDTVHGRKFLLVLDDVDEIFQVDMLMGNQSWYGPLSRIIITTRNTDVLGAIEMKCQREDLHDVYTSYKPDLMGDCHSLELFSKYAFMRDSPMEGYHILCNEVVSIAAGLPLVLVVLGSTFFLEKDKSVWEEKLKKLRAIPHDEVLKKLRFSFEALEYEQKQIFLDIACLFIGSDQTLPSYFWDDCGFYPRDGISILVRRSLITVSDDKLMMHDQLKDLGRHIVREEGLNEFGKQSRLWCTEEAKHMLETRQGTSSVHALCAPYAYEESDRPLVASHFHDLPNLRYLFLCGQEFDGDFKHLLSNLRWLQCIYLSGKFTPTNLNLKNLVILKLINSQFTESWKGWSQIKMAKKLKVLHLKSCSNVRVLPHLSTFSSLEILQLEDCKSLCSLDGLQQLKSLQVLDVSFCGLRRLPSLSDFEKLVKLNLEGCRKLIKIQGLEKLESLQHLNIKGCRSLKRLPTISNLKKLRTFQASGCCKLIHIEGLHSLKSLEFLDLSSCSSLKGVPDLSNYNKLEVLRAPSLEITDFSNLKKLKELHVSFSDNLIKLQGLDELEVLENLYIGDCRFIKRILNISYLKRLRVIRISVCDQLIEIQDFRGLESLAVLDLTGCASLERLPNLSNLRKLYLFSCRNCPKLIEIQGLDKLESLKILSLSVCSIEKLPDLTNLGVLKCIEVKGCHRLKDVAGLEVIESLEGLHIHFCNELLEIPDLRSLKNLKELSIRFLMKLTEISGLEELKYLESLDITGCKSIEALPNFSNFEKLKRLQASSCIKLTEICGLEDLKFLEILNITGCKALRNLPDLPNTWIERECPFHDYYLRLTGLDQLIYSEARELVD